MNQGRGGTYTYGPILREAVLLQVLKGEPIQLANVKLAFSDLLQGPLFRRAELDLGNGFLAVIYPGWHRREVGRAGAYRASSLSTRAAAE
jgi:hypothetical protein